MMKIITGIDDLATGRQLSEGWTYFVIEEELLIEFSKDAQELLNKTKLNSFHGKDYKRRFKDTYIQFLKLCRSYSEKSNISLIAVVLQNEIWKNQYSGFTDRIIKNVYGNNNIDNSEIITATQKLTTPLFSLQNLTKQLSSRYTMEIKIDSENITRNFNSLEIEVSTNIGSTSMKANKLLNILYNKYRSLQFPNSPVLDKNGISVCSDENSFLIQAADIVGNFSLSYIYSKLGKTSNTIKEKAEIFSNVFGDKFDNVNISNDLKLSESNEFQLTYDGQQILMFGRYSDKE